MKTTTPKGVEGFGISFSDELSCDTKLRKILPKDWSIKFSWVQILFSDVQYEIAKKKKEIQVVYNQNLHIWENNLVDEIKEKLIKMKVIEKAPSLENAI